jgi:aspartyl-tRNA(Asn)/glutamyl-tRNA(Gln) amidotransferase subunit B
MEEGTLRCDANVSLQPRGGEPGIRTEVKNMNSIRSVERALAFEIARQTEVLGRGEPVVQETRHWDERRAVTFGSRSKEEAQDYRYFPEPDLVPVEPEAELIDRLRSELPESPGARIRRLEQDVGFETGWELVTTGRDRLYDELNAIIGEPRVVANFVMNPFAAAGVDPSAAITNAPEVAKLVQRRDTIPRINLEAAIAASATPGFSAAPYLAQEQISDAAELQGVIDGVLAANPGQVEAYRAGKHGLLGFFVGQVMKETSGTANPKLVGDLLRERLGP